MLNNSTTIVRNTLKRKLFALDSIPKTLQLKGKNKVILVGGVFDILHFGHFGFLEYAKQFGNFLVVAIDSDSSVRLKKGPNRPILDEKIRATNVAMLSCVDFLFITDKPMYDDLVLQKIKPDILLRPIRYNMINHKEYIKEFTSISEIKYPSLKVIFFDEERRISSTEIIERIVTKQWIQHNPVTY